jgi:secondary thiamine-phosphate synthase enzyme
VRQASTDFTVRTRGKGLYEFTGEVAAWVREQRIGEGLLTLFVRHTSASLLIQENADPDVVTDLKAWFERVAPEDARLYRHTMEGPDDMPAHIRAAVTPVSLGIPVRGGRLSLGTWQGIYLFEHRAAPHTRSIAGHLIGV